MTRDEKIKIRRIYLLLSSNEREDREKIFENIGRVQAICEDLLFPGEVFTIDEFEEKIREI